MDWSGILDVVQPLLAALLTVIAWQARQIRVEVRDARHHLSTFEARFTAYVTATESRLTRLETIALINRQRENGEP